MEVGQFCNVAAAIAPDSPNALQLLVGVLLCYPIQTMLVHGDAGDGLDLVELVQAEGLQQSEHSWQRLFGDLQAHLLWCAVFSRFKQQYTGLIPKCDRLKVTQKMLQNVINSG